MQYILTSFLFLFFLFTHTIGHCLSTPPPSQKEATLSNAFPIYLDQQKEIQLLSYKQDTDLNFSVLYQDETISLTLTESPPDDNKKGSHLFKKMKIRRDSVI